VSDIPQVLGGHDFRLRELERRAPALTDDGMGNLDCRGAIKLYSESNQSIGAGVTYEARWSGTMYACNASMVQRSAQNTSIMFEEQTGIWHVTGELHIISGGTSDIYVELWTDHGTTDHILSYNRDKSTSSDTAEIGVSADAFFNYGDTVWLVAHATSGTMQINAHPANFLTAHLVHCNCTSTCDWTATCAGWDLTC
jgi:hypothetical protein